MFTNPISDCCDVFLIWFVYVIVFAVNLVNYDPFSDCPIHIEIPTRIVNMIKSCISRYELIKCGEC